MKNVHYRWQTITDRNFEESRIKGFKHLHHVNFALFHGLSYFRRTPLHYRKEFKKIKYVHKCTFPGGVQIDKYLRENFLPSKNSIQTLLLKEMYPLEGFVLKENVDIKKILCYAKNLQRIRWLYALGVFEGSLKRCTSLVPKKSMMGLRIPLPKHLQIQFEFRFGGTIKGFRGEGTFPKFQVRMTCQGDPWRIVSVEIVGWVGFMKSLNVKEIPEGIEGFWISVFGEENELEDMKKLFTLCGCDRMRKLKRLEMKANIEKFSPSDLKLLEELPDGLEALKLRIEAANMLEDEKTMGDFLTFGKKVNGLKKLRVLDLRFPTSFYVNQMIHNMKEGMGEMEEVLLEFVEDKKHAIYEEFYVNSYVEWLMTMPKLKKIRLRTTKLNYTYCSFLAGQKGFENLESIEWIDDSLERMRKRNNDYKTKIWVECKKPEDLGVVLDLINEEKAGNIEIPLVFDGLSGDFGLRKLREVVGKLRNLKRLSLYVGFKLLEEENIRLVEEFLNGLSLKEKVECFVCYRELTKEARDCMMEISKRKRSAEINFVCCVCP